MNYFQDECIRKYIKDEMEEFLAKANYANTLEYVLDRFAVHEISWEEVKKTSERFIEGNFPFFAYNTQKLVFHEGKWRFFIITETVESERYYKERIVKHEQMLIFCYEANTEYYSTNSQLLMTELQLLPCEVCKKYSESIEQLWDWYIEKRIEVELRAKLDCKC